MADEFKYIIKTELGFDTGSLDRLVKELALADQQLKGKMKELTIGARIAPNAIQAIQRQIGTMNATAVINVRLNETSYQNVRRQLQELQKLASVGQTASKDSHLLKQAQDMDKYTSAILRNTEALEKQQSAMNARTIISAVKNQPSAEETIQQRRYKKVGSPSLQTSKDTTAQDLKEIQDVARKAKANVTKYGNLMTKWQGLTETKGWDKKVKEYEAKQEEAKKSLARAQASARDIEAEVNKLLMQEDTLAAKMQKLGNKLDSTTFTQLNTKRLEKQGGNSSERTVNPAKTARTPQAKDSFSLPSGKYNDWSSILKDLREQATMGAVVQKQIDEAQRRRDGLDKQRGATGRLKLSARKGLASVDQEIAELQKKLVEAHQVEKAIDEVWKRINGERTGAALKLKPDHQAIRLQKEKISEETLFRQINAEAEHVKMKLQGGAGSGLGARDRRMLSGVKGYYDEQIRIMEESLKKMQEIRKKERELDKEENRQRQANGQATKPVREHAALLYNTEYRRAYEEVRRARELKKSLSGLNEILPQIDENPPITKMKYRKQPHQNVLTKEQQIAADMTLLPKSMRPGATTKILDPRIIEPIIERGKKDQAHKEALGINSNPELLLRNTVTRERQQPLIDQLMSHYAAQAQVTGTNFSKTLYHGMLDPNGFIQPVRQNYKFKAAEFGPQEAAKQEVITKMKMRKSPVYGPVTKEYADELDNFQSMPTGKASKILDQRYLQGIIERGKKNQAEKEAYKINADPELLLKNTVLPQNQKNLLDQLIAQYTVHAQDRGLNFSKSFQMPVRDANGNLSTIRTKPYQFKGQGGQQAPVTDREKLLSTITDPARQKEIIGQLRTEYEAFAKEMGINFSKSFQLAVQGADGKISTIRTKPYQFKGVESTANPANGDDASSAWTKQGAHSKLPMSGPALARVRQQKINDLEQSLKDPYLPVDQKMKNFEELKKHTAENAKQYGSTMNRAYTFEQANPDGSISRMRTSNYEFDKLGNITEKTGRGFGGLMQAMGRNLIGYNLIQTAMFAVSGAFYGAVKAMAEFEQQMKGMGLVTKDIATGNLKPGMTGFDDKTITQAVMDISKRNGVDPSSVTAPIYNEVLRRKDLYATSDDAKKYTESIVQMGVVAGASQGRRLSDSEYSKLAVDDFALYQNLAPAWKKSGLDPKTEMQGYRTYIANLSTQGANVDKTYNAMGELAPLVSDGVSEKSLAAIVGSLSHRTDDSGNQMGNNIKLFFTNLLKGDDGSGGAQAAQKVLGISPFNAKTGTNTTIQEAINRIQEMMANGQLTEEKLSAVATNVARSSGGGGGGASKTKNMNILHAIADAPAMQQEAEKATTTLQELSDYINSALTPSFAKLGASFKDFAVNIGDSGLLMGLKNTVDATTGIVNFLNGVFQSWNNIEAASVKNMGASTWNMLGLPFARQAWQLWTKDYTNPAGNDPSSSGAAQGLSVQDQTEARKKREDAFKNAKAVIDSTTLHNQTNLTGFNNQFQDMTDGFDVSGRYVKQGMAANSLKFLGAENSPAYFASRMGVLQKGLQSTSGLHEQLASTMAQMSNQSETAGAAYQTAKGKLSAEQLAYVNPKYDFAKQSGDFTPLTAELTGQPNLIEYVRAKQGFDQVKEGQKELKTQAESLTQAYEEQITQLKELYTSYLVASSGVKLFEGALQGIKAETSHAQAAAHIAPYEERGKTAASVLTPLSKEAMLLQQELDSVQNKMGEIASNKPGDYTLAALNHPDSNGLSAEQSAYKDLLQKSYEIQGSLDAATTALHDQRDAYVDILMSTDKYREMWDRVNERIDTVKSTLKEMADLKLQTQNQQYSENLRSQVLGNGFTPDEYRRQQAAGRRDEYLALAEKMNTAILSSGGDADKLKQAIDEVNGSTGNMIRDAVVEPLRNLITTDAASAVDKMGQAGDLINKGAATFESASQALLTKIQDIQIQINGAISPSATNPFSYSATGDNSLFQSLSDSGINSPSVTAGTVDWQKKLADDYYSQVAKKYPGSVLKDKDKGKFMSEIRGGYKSDGEFTDFLASEIAGKKDLSIHEIDKQYFQDYKGFKINSPEFKTAKQNMHRSFDSEKEMYKHLSTQLVKLSYQRQADAANKKAKPSPSKSASTNDPYAKFRDEINSASSATGVPAAVISGIIQKENPWLDPTREGPVTSSGEKAKGLMQLMPANIKEQGVKDWKNPAQNILGGSKEFAGYLKKYGNIEWALAAYNAGPGNADKWRKQGIPISKIPFKQTREYIPEVMKNIQAFSGTNSFGSSITSDQSNYLGFSQFKDNALVKGDLDINPLLYEKLANLAKSKGKPIQVSSGGRRPDQQPLSRRKQGIPVADPGFSKHQYGLAADVSDDWLKKMSNAELEQFGLYKAVKSEDWHIEPIETKKLPSRKSVGDTKYKENMKALSKSLMGQSTSGSLLSLTSSSKLTDTAAQLKERTEQAKISKRELEMRAFDEQVKYITSNPVQSTYDKSMAEVTTRSKVSGKNLDLVLGKQDNINEARMNIGRQTYDNGVQVKSFQDAISQRQTEQKAAVKSGDTKLAATLGLQITALQAHIKTIQSNTVALNKLEAQYNAQGRLDPRHNSTEAYKIIGDGMAELKKLVASGQSGGIDYYKKVEEVSQMYGDFLTTDKKVNLSQDLFDKTGFGYEKVGQLKNIKFAEDLALLLGQIQSVGAELNKFAQGTNKWHTILEDAVALQEKIVALEDKKTEMSRKWFEMTGKGLAPYVNARAFTQSRDYVQARNNRTIATQQYQSNGSSTDPNEQLVSLQIIADAHDKMIGIMNEYRDAVVKSYKAGAISLNEYIQRLYDLRDIQDETKQQTIGMMDNMSGGFHQALSGAIQSGMQGNFDAPLEFMKNIKSSLASTVSSQFSNLLLDNSGLKNVMEGLTKSMAESMNTGDVNKSLNAFNGGDFKKKLDSALSPFLPLIQQISASTEGIFGVLNDQVYNAPSGFKIDDYMYNMAKGKTYDDIKAWLPWDPAKRNEAGSPMGWNTSGNVNGPINVDPIPPPKGVPYQTTKPIDPIRTDYPQPMQQQPQATYNPVRELLNALVTVKSQYDMSRPVTDPANALTHSTAEEIRAALRQVAPKVADAVGNGMKGSMDLGQIQDYMRSADLSQYDMVQGINSLDSGIGGVQGGISGMNAGVQGRIMEVVGGIGNVVGAIQGLKLGTVPPTVPYNPLPTTPPPGAILIPPGSSQLPSGSGTYKNGYWYPSSSSTSPVASKPEAWTSKDTSGTSIGQYHYGDQTGSWNKYGEFIADTAQSVKSVGTKIEQNSSSLQSGLGGVTSGMTTGLGGVTTGMTTGLGGITTALNGMKWTVNVSVAGGSGYSSGGGGSSSGGGGGGGGSSSGGSSSSGGGISDRGPNSRDSSSTGSSSSGRSSSGSSAGGSSASDRSPSRSSDRPSPSRYASGGYTGSWGSEGRLAILDQKELVLNQGDTANMLKTMELVRGMFGGLGSGVAAFADITRFPGNGGASGAALGGTTINVNINVNGNGQVDEGRLRGVVTEAVSRAVTEVTRQNRLNNLQFTGRS